MYGHTAWGAFFILPRPPPKSSPKRETPGRHFVCRPGALYGRRPVVWHHSGFIPRRRDRLAPAEFDSPAFRHFIVDRRHITRRMISSGTS